jgi:hypothetical protein
VGKGTEKSVTAQGLFVFKQIATDFPKACTPAAQLGSRLQPNYQSIQYQRLPNWRSALAGVCKALNGSLQETDML